MSEADSLVRAAFELPLARRGKTPRASSGTGSSSSLPERLLVRNLVWFCKLRWVVIGAFLAFGIFGLCPALLPRLGLRTQGPWPFVMAGILILTNVGYLLHARALARSHAPRGAAANLWTQIVLDLVVATGAVHHLGSVETYAAFAYIFHIVLACIFFSRGQSLVVTLIACVLFVACVGVEEANIVGRAGIFSEAPERTRFVLLLDVAWALATWIVVWYLGSHLSELVRARDAELAESNRCLIEAQDEKARHMLRTTHEMKAPFAAIDANAQLLLGGYCGKLSDEALDVARRIAARCRRLAGEIQEMLQLANLRGVKMSALRWKELDLAAVIEWCIKQVQVSAEQRGVVIEKEIEPARTVAVEDHMKMLFSNLVTNAVAYSREKGTVRVTCAPSPGSGPVVTVEDHGIGIPAEKLPQIFEEYYRTNEAVRHNKESTGLGLTIVRHVAETHGIHVRAESQVGVGTKFTLIFPAANNAADRQTEREVTSDGAHNDR